MSSKESALPYPLNESSPAEAKSEPDPSGQQALHAIASVGEAKQIVITSPPPESGSSYKIGWSRPPLHGRFKPGQSGNPKGRRKGSKNEITLWTDLLDGEKVTLRENGKTRRITVREAIYRKTTQDALKGDLKAAKFVLERYASVKAGEAGPGELSAEEREIIDAYLDRSVSERSEAKS